MEGNMKVTGKKTEKKVPAKGRALTRQKTPKWRSKRDVPRRYRELKIGEKVRKGDLFWCGGIEWFYTHSPGTPVVEGQLTYIRRIKAKAPARKASRKGAK
jgi:hypothetical protein